MGCHFRAWRYETYLYFLISTLGRQLSIEMRDIVIQGYFARRPRDDIRLYETDSSGHRTM